MQEEIKAITDLAEIENAEDEHVMVPTEEDNHENTGDPQEHHHTLIDPTMEGMNTPVIQDQAVVTMPSPKPAKTFKEFVESKGGDVTLSDDNKTLIVKGLMSFTNSGKKSMADYKPSQEDINSINKNHSNIDLSRDDILTFTLRSADMAVDRSYEHFTESALQKMAQLSVGKAFLMDHDWTTTSHIGKIYDASVENGQLLQKVYVLNDVYNKKVISNILAGIYNKVSVGFGVDLNNMVCDSCGTKSYYDEVCPHSVGNDTTITIKDVSDYFEVSLVPVPAQRDAGIRRSYQKSGDEFNDSVTKIASLLDGAINAKKSNTIENSEVLLKDIKEVFEEVIDEELLKQENIKSSDTITNSRTVLGDMAVPENEQDKQEAKAKSDLANVPEVDAKPGHVNDSGKAADDKEDKEKPEAKAEGCVAMADDEDDDQKSLEKQLAKSIKKLNKLTKNHKKSLAKQLKAVEEMNTANEGKVKQLETQVKEQGERLVALFAFVEEAASKSYESLLQESNMMSSNVEKSAKSAGQWFSNLNDGFLSGGQ